MILVFLTSWKIFHFVTCSKKCYIIKPRRNKIIPEDRDVESRMYNDPQNAERASFSNILTVVCKVYFKHTCIGSSFIPLQRKDLKIQVYQGKIRTLGYGGKSLLSSKIISYWQPSIFYSFVSIHHHRYSCLSEQTLRPGKGDQKIQ